MNWQTLLSLLLQPMVLEALVFAAKMALVVLVVLVVCGVLMSWLERKQSAILQDRLGANRAAILGFRLWGIITIIADAIKGFTKEDFSPAKGNKFLHALAPVVTCTAALACFGFLPFGGKVRVPGLPELQSLTVIPTEVGLLIVFGLLSLGIYGIVLAGYASDNKYSVLGAVRATAQMISYEVTLGMTIMGLLLIYRTLDLTGIAMAQHQITWLGGWIPLPHWGVLLQPVGFLLFLTAAVAESKRVPFDLPEGESEIIGYSIEYSSMKFLVFMMAEFMEMVLFAWLITTLFFGGWNIPGLHLVDGGVSGFFYHGGLRLELNYWVVVALQALAVVVKTAAFTFLLMQIRWTYPRFRYDQLMRLGWKMLLPISLANVAVTAVIAYYLNS